MGCGDFVSPTIYQLRAGGVLSLSDSRVTTVHNSFNFRYAPSGLTWPNPAERGTFVGGYQRDLLLEFSISPEKRPVTPEMRVVAQFYLSFDDRPI